MYKPFYGTPCRLLWTLFSASNKLHAVYVAHQLYDIPCLQPQVTNRCFKFIENLCRTIFGGLYQLIILRLTGRFKFYYYWIFFTGFWRAMHRVVRNQWAFQQLIYCQPNPYFLLTIPTQSTYLLPIFELFWILPGKMALY